MLVAYTVGLELIRALRPVVVQLQKHSAEAAKQVEEAASSIVRNIAEGQRRRGRDPVRFYAMAHGSANEVRGQLDVADASGWDVDSAEARRVLDRERNRDAQCRRNRRAHRFPGLATSNADTTGTRTDSADSRRASPTRPRRTTTPRVDACSAVRS